MKTKTFSAIFALLMLATLSACEIDKTEEGELPDVDLSVEGGNLPEYDVDTADVSVETQEQEVEVPDVDVDVGTETKTVDVPNVEVDMPEDDEDKPQ